MSSDGEHMPWDDPWSGVGVPKSGFWTDERVEQADDLVTDFLASSFDRVVRNGLAAEERTKRRPASSDVPLVVVSNEFSDVVPIRYDKRHLTGMATETAVRHARGASDAG
jgi:hypothetical protein